METVIRYLIFVLKTVDGHKNSAEKVIKKMNMDSLKELKE